MSAPEQITPPGRPAGELAPEGEPSQGAVREGTATGFEAAPGGYHGTGAGSGTKATSPGAAKWAPLEQLWALGVLQEANRLDPEAWIFAPNSIDPEKVRRVAEFRELFRPARDNGGAGEMKVNNAPKPAWLVREVRLVREAPDAYRVTFVNRRAGDVVSVEIRPYQLPQTA